MISQIVFNLYIDRLLLYLQRSCLGCHISNTYMGALLYADDITLFRNKAIRKIFSLPYQSHRWLLGPLIVQYHKSNQLIRRDIKCVYRMINCPNAIIRQCILNAYYKANS